MGLSGFEFMTFWQHFDFVWIIFRLIPSLSKISAPFPRLGPNIGKVQNFRHYSEQWNNYSTTYDDKARVNEFNYGLMPPLWLCLIPDITCYIHLATHRGCWPPSGWLVWRRTEADSAIPKDQKHLKWPLTGFILYCLFKILIFINSLIILHLFFWEIVLNVLMLQG